MVIRKRKIHHGSNSDLVVLDNRPLLDGVHAEYRTLRRVKDRRGEKRSEDAAVRDRESSALEVINGNLAITGPLGQLPKLFLDLGKAQAVGIPEDRHHQTPFRADCDAD